jgi:hypothetical protein
MHVIVIDQNNFVNYLFSGLVTSTAIILRPFPCTILTVSTWIEYTQPSIATVPVLHFPFIRALSTWLSGKWRSYRCTTQMKKYVYTLPQS